MSRKILAMLLILCMTISFAACGTQTPAASQAPQSAEATATPAASTEASASEEPSPAAEPFTISVADWMIGTGNPNSQSYMDFVTKGYAAIYPQATIEWNPIQGEQYHELLKAQLASGNAPDIFAFQNAIVPFGKAGYLTDLSDQPWTKDILDSTRVDITYDGKILAAPVDVAGWGIFYNKKVFADLGVTPPKTFDEFLAICDKANDKKIVPLTGGYKEWQAAAPPYGLQSFLYGANPNVAADLYNGKTQINGPEFTALFTALETMYKRGAYAKDILSTTYEQAQQLIGEGKAAMIIDGPWICPAVADKYKADLGFFVMPDVQGKVTMTTSVNSEFGLNAMSKFQNEGLALVGILVSKDAVPLLLKNSSFSGMKGYSVEQLTTGAREYNDALSQYPAGPQFSSWLPPSTYDKFTQICTKTISGQPFDVKDLEDIDATYLKDKGLINILK